MCSEIGTCTKIFVKEKKRRNKKLGRNSKEKKMKDRGTQFQKNRRRERDERVRLSRRTTTKRSVELTGKGESGSGTGRKGNKRRQDGGRRRPSAHTEASLERVGAYVDKIYGDQGHRKGRKNKPRRSITLGNQVRRKTRKRVEVKESKDTQVVSKQRVRQRMGCVWDLRNQEIRKAQREVRKETMGSKGTVTGETKYRDKNSGGGSGRKGMRDSGGTGYMERDSGGAGRETIATSYTTGVEEKTGEQRKGGRQDTGGTEKRKTRNTGGADKEKTRYTGGAEKKTWDRSDKDERYTGGGIEDRKTWDIGDKDTWDTRGKDERYTGGDIEKKRYTGHGKKRHTGDKRVRRVERRERYRVVREREVRSNGRNRRSRRKDSNRGHRRQGWGLKAKYGEEQEIKEVKEREKQGLEKRYRVVEKEIQVGREKAKEERKDRRSKGRESKGREKRREESRTKTEGAGVGEYTREIVGDNVKWKNQKTENCRKNENRCCRGRRSKINGGKGGYEEKRVKRKKGKKVKTQELDMGALWRKGEKRRVKNDPIRKNLPMRERRQENKKRKNVRRIGERKDITDKERKKWIKVPEKERTKRKPEWEEMRNRWDMEMKDLEKEQRKELRQGGKGKEGKYRDRGKTKLYKYGMEKIRREREKKR